MKRSLIIILAAILFSTMGCDSGGDGDEEYIADLSDVPAVVLSAARAAVPGLVISRVEREESRRGTIYEVYGRANGRFYELEIGSDGTVFEIEIDDDD
ncbi:MAG: hypothetical protein OXM02_01955 [Bacteroidota bacterium]|nr:hypothetical protein [Bacteroidota bacterium]MDE2833269.1 hypothetical protein [Bacteroidota bacterium]